MPTAQQSTGTAETLTIRDEGTVDVLCGATPRGPVVLGDPADGVALSMQWTGMFGADTTLGAPCGRCWSRALTAELIEAVRPWGAAGEQPAGG